jgi:hypothetical protein
VDVRRARGGRGEDPRERTKKKKRKEKNDAVAGDGVSTRCEATRRDATHPVRGLDAVVVFQVRRLLLRGHSFRFIEEGREVRPGREGVFFRVVTCAGVRRVDALRSDEKRVAVERYTRGAMGERQTERTRPGRRKSFSIDVRRAREAVWEVVSRTDGVQHADRPARVADRLTHVVHLLG